VMAARNVAMVILLQIYMVTKCIRENPVILFLRTVALFTICAHMTLVKVSSVYGRKLLLSP
jgi:hypothetical protein